MAAIHYDAARLAGYRYPKRYFIGGTAMSDYSYLSILKTCAKKLARIQKIKLSKALEIVARDAKFTSYHELSEVAKRAPLEQRLVFAAIGEDTQEDVIYRDEIFYAIDREVEDMLSGDIAETNAYGF
ncbi:hypothetical protein CG970_25835, partial [Escherichia coli]|nr:hypothetical protein [Escherichia coli]